MAERRMFTKTIVMSDDFLEMPLSSRYLYFSLGVEAEDKGLLKNAKTITKAIGCQDSDLNELLKRGYLSVNDDEIYKYRICHWYENNGIGETAKKRNNYQYRKWRKEIINRDKCCKICGSTENLEAHHIKEFSKYPDMRFLLDNGITLCKKCHRKLHKEERTFNNGNL